MYNIDISLYDQYISINESVAVKQEANSTVCRCEYIYLNMRLWTLEDFGGWMVLGDGQRLLTLTLDVG